MTKLYLEDDLFGPLLPFIKDDDVTDINWNGEDLWVDHLKKGRKKIENISVTNDFIDQLAMKISNMVNKSFNQYEPTLEAETETLRISVIHTSQTNTGPSMSIRKVLPIRRLNREKMIDEQYCSADIDNFMRNAIKAHLNIFIAGEVGVGKTEYLKTLTEYIPDYERVITIEDSYEIKYRSINPGKDCVELKVSPYMSYSDAIKTSLRQFPKWILLSEARGLEVRDLLNSMSSGAYCITTGHANDVRNIPSRILNMMGEENKNTLNDIFTFIDIGILIRSITNPNDGAKRWIAQIACFSHEDEDNNITSVIYENGKMHPNLIPSGICQKLINAGIRNPFLL